MQDTINRIRKFRDERDWRQFHTPANLSKAISIEAGELLIIATHSPNVVGNIEAKNLRIMKKDKDGISILWKVLIT